MRSCDGHGAASQGNGQGNWPNPKASLFTDPRSLPGRMTEVNTASPVLAFRSGARRIALTCNVGGSPSEPRSHDRGHEVAITEEQLPDPNGIRFSSDHKTLCVISTGKGPGDSGPGGNRVIFAFDMQGTKPVNQRPFTDMTVDGVKCGPDGMRCDVDGNVWCSSNAGRAVGYSGVTVWNPAGKLIGRIRIPEIVANICFGGPKRNRLFIAASQSLYALYTSTQGAGPG